MNGKRWLEPKGCAAVKATDVGECKADLPELLSELKGPQAGLDVVLRAAQGPLDQSTQVVISLLVGFQGV